ncbi:MAG: response regulator transcription factor [Ferruginibacter sp.]|nr:response regulator transcription factor [Ferruginibacter sp.]
MQKFLLIDDHVIVRTGIKLLIASIYIDSQIDEAKDGDSALALVNDNEYDFAMLDVLMPNTDSLALMETFKEKCPNLKVLVFSMNAEKVYAMRYLKAGAKGFVSKDAPMDEVRKAIDMVLNGKKYISEEMLSLLAEGKVDSANKNPFSLLSSREFEIVLMLLNGKTISGIAAELQLGISTIGTHKGRIFIKLKVNNLLELQDLANVHNL